MRRAISFRSLALLVPLLGAGCAGDAPNTCQMLHLTDLPLTYRGILLTPAFLNDQPTTMLLDTGDTTTLINRSAAKRLNLSLHSTGGRLSGIGGHQDLYYFTAKTFRLGKLHGSQLDLGASDIGADPDHTLIDGVLGSDFLSSYEVDLDLPEHKLRLFKVIAGCGTPAANLDEPLYLAPLVRPDNPNDRRPHVRVLIGGIWFDAVVDSGAHRTSLFRNAANRLGLRLADLATDPHGHAVGFGPKARDSVQHIMTPIQVGEITISNLPVSIIDQRSDDGEEDMLLGLDFMARVHVWISFHSQTLLMQYPPRPSPKVADEP